MPFDRRLLALTGSVRGFLAATVGMGAAAGLLIVVQALIVSQSIARAFGGETGVIGGLLLALAVVIGLRAAVTWALPVFANRVAGRVKLTLRARLAAKLTQLGPAYTTNERSGELAATFGDGIEAFDAYFGQYLPQVFLSMIVPGIVGVAVGLADPLSGVVLLVTLPTLPIFMILIGKSAEARNKRQWQQLGSLSAHFLDVLQGLTTLKLLGRSRHQAATIERISLRYRDVTLGVLRVAFLSALVMELGATISTAIVAVEVGLRLVASDISFAAALTVLLLAPEFYLPLRSLGARFHAGMSAGAAATRIFSILDMPVERGSTPYLFGTTPPTIRFEGVGYSHPEREIAALTDIDVTIMPGSITAIIGASGAGKSTMGALLMGFIQPQSGAIRVSDGLRDVRLADLDPDDWRKQVAWLPQSPYLFHASVADNIRLGNPAATDAEVAWAAAQAQADDFIGALPQGYATIIGERGARLSGGQAQRIALARALLKNAPVLILDEATAHIDPATEAAVLDTISRIAADRTVLFITHSAQSIMRATMVVRLDGGRVVSVSRKEAVLV